MILDYYKCWQELSNKERAEVAEWQGVSEPHAKLIYDWYYNRVNEIIEKFEYEADCINVVWDNDIHYEVEGTINANGIKISYPPDMPPEASGYILFDLHFDLADNEFDVQRIAEI